MKKDEKEKNYSIPEPSPTQTKESIEVVPLVLKDIEDRMVFGIRKYGTPLMTHNGRDALADAYQESLDQTIYLRQLLAERDGE